MPKIQSTGQTTLPMDYFRELDRNFDKGGRSFYFFDFDDNVVHLDTKILIFHKKTNASLAVSTQEWAQIHTLIGKPSTPYPDYEILLEPLTGSYQNFRDHPERQTQPLVEDVESAIKSSLLDWRGPSWDIFVHAVYNNRPIAVITARGHHAHTIRRAIDVLVQSRDLTSDPNYLSIYAVSHPETRKLLGDEKNEWSTAELKKVAIHKAVNDAFDCYGDNPHHRFGMSDDDPHNVLLIEAAMRELKQQRPQNAFYVINTHQRQLVKNEILLDHASTETDESPNAKELLEKQLSLLE